MFNYLYIVSIMLKSIILNAERQPKYESGYRVLDTEIRLHIAEQNAPYFQTLLQATQISACLTAFTM